MFDPHLHQTLEDGDGVFGNELLEGDEERGLDGDTSTYLRSTNEGKDMLENDCLGNRNG